MGSCTEVPCTIVQTQRSAGTVRGLAHTLNDGLLRAPPEAVRAPASNAHHCSCDRVSMTRHAHGDPPPYTCAIAYHVFVFVRQQQWLLKHLLV
jgi:hypothetical protein